MKTSKTTVSWEHRCDRCGALVVVDTNFLPGWSYVECRIQAIPRTETLDYLCFDCTQSFKDWLNKLKQ